jgi:hypothetical protein
MKFWSEYFELSKNRPPNPVLESALKLVVDRTHALDLGAGSLKDSKFMLSSGFKKVTAVDIEADCRKYRQKIPAAQLKISVCPFEELTIKANSYNFINAQYSLPFTTPPHLPGLVKQITAGLRPAGLFCGQFFGLRDSWNTPGSKRSFVTKKDLLQWLKALELVYFREEEQDGKTIDGKLKHWHVFHVIALKPLSVNQKIPRRTTRTSVQPHRLKKKSPQYKLKT